ncbi:related to Kinesin-like protein KIF23 [Serendipita indica DSM 11827]|uniref:Kinesin-like protein n=1 Tax=Serendipita indica (strain DSM 11827) TaxID=1109443 RepID=G4TLE1_SERID|nr:related to Kinesin-like protein KIF23 [Serendipita indica DSM 11827]
MATRARKVNESKEASNSRLGGTTAAATRSATQPIRATRSTRGAAAAVDATETPKVASKTRAGPKKTANATEKVAPPLRKAPVKVSKKATQPTTVEENDRDTIKAFLRIRPNKENDEREISSPYLKALSETTVQMTDPSSSRIRTISSIPPVSTYTFTHVFENTTQSKFFQRVALPLVQSLLAGENGLLFAYGVTNSGKTYSIQGGHGDEEAGILPRTLDVVFNSIDTLLSDRVLRPKGLGSVESLVSEEPIGSELLQEKEERTSTMINEVLGHSDIPALQDENADETVLPVDKNYEYAVWVSYAEVYNEKIFDLLSVSDPTADNSKPHTIGNAVSSYLNLAALASSSSSNIPVTLHRRALGLKTSPDGMGKYVHGLREVRVKNAREAKAVVRMGTINRRVFGTVANAVSSRSHAIFTIKLAKIHRGASQGELTDDDVSVSRLSLVDLAGSERARNAGTSRVGEGERLREAGSINKSLMVLGQCLEAMRTNQKRLAVAGAAPIAKGEHGLLEKPKLAIVPFRHSKITELFQDYFVGEGRAVMIININPYDTGFDENAHVMRFAALAREVVTNLPGTLGTSVLARGPSFLPPLNTASRAPSRLASTTAARSLQTSTRKVMLSLGGSSGKGTRGSVNTVVDVIEEDAAMDVDDQSADEEEEATFSLVEELFSRIEELECKAAEMRAAMVETETREEVAQEMEERLHVMERMYRDRMTREAEENDRKTDEKMDLLHRALKTGGGTLSPVKKASRPVEQAYEETEQCTLVKAVTP